jgi:integrase
MSKAFTKLTRPNMRKLAAKGKISEQGITFERQPNSDGVFIVNVMVDGQRIHRVIGRESEGTTRLQAEEFIEKARNDAKHDRLSLPKGRKVALLFRDAAAKYLEKLGESGGKDLKMKTARLKHHLIPFFGDTPLSRITAFDIDRYKKRRTEERNEAKPDGKTNGRIPHGACKPGTINRELATLSHLFSMARDWGWIEHSPKIKRFPEGQGRITYLTAEQVARLVECAKKDNSPFVYPFILIGVETSMRMREILSIRKEHIDTARRVIFIPKAKAGAREQPITQTLADFLSSHVQALPPGSPWLFSSPGAKGGHTTSIVKAFRRVVEAAGLDPHTVVRHTLRHTAITHLVQAGVDLPTVQRISGHKTLSMVARYSHQNGEHIQEAMNKLQTRLKLVA